MAARGQAPLPRDNHAGLGERSTGVYWHAARREYRQAARSSVGRITAGKSSTMQSASELATVTTHDRVGVITINNPPVNALGPGVAEAIQTAVEQLAANPAVEAIVLIGGGRTFI